MDGLLDAEGDSEGLWEGEIEADGDRDGELEDEGAVARTAVSTEAQARGPVPVKTTKIPCLISSGVAKVMEELPVAMAESFQHL